jgi:RNA polymerase sigma factor (sigma-70 family)
MESAALRDQLAASHEASFAWALGCCGRDRREAEEVLQAVYLKVLDGRARFEGRSSFRTWLFAVIRRTAADYSRRAVRRALRLVTLERSLGELPAASAPDEDAEAAERRELLARALERLPRRQREVLLLVFYHEHTVDEAAAVMGIGVGSARTHYARGKSRLRALLEESGWTKI